MTTKRILCIDDDEDIRFLLTTLLSKSDLNAMAVPSVTEALLLMKKERFCLYIIDSQLPGISGLSLCKEIRKLDKQTPIIIFTGKGYEADRVAGMLAGANAYLVKPDISQLLPTIESLLAQVASSR
jgi:DNA-binding response OmpR family regulator